jgi:hypothetical protein
MSTEPLSPLLHILSDPDGAAGFGDADWDLTIRQGRAAGLLATVCHLLNEAGRLDAVPERPRVQLQAAARIAARHREVTRWEMEELYRLLERIGVPMIVLKGAAYVVADLDAAKGRMFGDVDIMVPRGAIEDVERALGRAGWVQESQSAYDDRYYRKWMHEIPARRHAQRGTVLDVHHNLLPLTARHKPQAKHLWDAALPVQGFDDLYVLSRPDMLLHTASHLFCNGEFDRGLRDLYDFRRLASQFAVTGGFWTQVAERAAQLDLARPLGYAVRYANRLLGAGIPTNSLPGTAQARTHWLDGLFVRALLPNHSTVHDAWTPAALFALYVRGHYLRMPLHLLLPHLLYKATLAKVHEEKVHTENQKKLEAFRAFLGK